MLIKEQVIYRPPVTAALRVWYARLTTYHDPSGGIIRVDQIAQQQLRVFF
jgi:hypothetical protein